MDMQESELQEYAAGVRRTLHKHPEIGFDLPRTCALVKSELESFGLEVDEKYGAHSLVAEIQGARPGKTVALRADMDALPLQEETACPFSSQRPGFMHACGHDGHTAMLLGVARLLRASADSLSGRVRLIFQASEEGPGSGAKRMVEDGVMEGVDKILALHLTTEHPTGTIAAAPGRAMAAATVFDIEIRGRGGHAGSPHTTVDAIALSVKAANEFQYIVSRELDPFEPAVLSIGVLSGGSASNIVSERCSMSGTIRSFSLDLQREIKEKIRRVLEGVVLQAGGEYSLTFNDGLPPLLNDPEAVAAAFESAEKIIGTENCRILDRGRMGAEDFVYYLQKAPGCILWLGARDEKEGHVFPLHHPKFSFDEKALSVGIKIFYQFVKDQLA